jgi:ribonuclease HII
MNKEADTKKIDKDKYEKILEVIVENLEYEIETTGYQEYDIQCNIDKSNDEKVMKAINEILEE